jgi:hypothetical protein
MSTRNLTFFNFFNSKDERGFQIILIIYLILFILMDTISVYHVSTLVIIKSVVIPRRLFVLCFFIVLFFRFLTYKLLVDIISEFRFAKAVLIYIMVIVFAFLHSLPLVSTDDIYNYGSLGRYLYFSSILKSNYHFRLILPAIIAFELMVNIIIIVLRKSKKKLIQADHTIKAKEDEFIATVEMVQHEIGNKIPIIKGSIKKIESVLNLKNIDLNLKVANPLDGELETDIDSIKDLFNNANKNIDFALTAMISLKELLDVNKDITTKKNAYILKEIKKIVGLSNYNFNIEFGDEDFEFLFSEKHLEILIDNFLRNAELHAFKEILDNNCVKFILFKKDNSLLIMNNGIPFPKDFSIEDFITSGAKRSEKGRGIGGFIIFKILEKNGYSIKLEQPIGEFKTVFKIYKNG